VTDPTTTPVYRERLTTLRNAFPAPVSDQMHDAYFVFSIMRALDQVDAMKSEVPMLGHSQALDYAAAEQAELGEDTRTVEEVSRLLVDKLEGMPIWGHPQTQINVVPPPSIPSIIGSLLPAIYNPNLVSDDTSYGLALTEASVAAMTARLVGYDAATSAGVFTFGGTGTTMYGVKLGIEKAFPEAMHEGIHGEGIILASAQSHYCRLNVAGWLGLGEKNVVAVPTHQENDIRIDDLEVAARAAIEANQRIVTFVATMGTTDAFGVDDLESIVHLRDRLVEEYSLDYAPHVHADAVIGWAWSVFNDYDFEQNALEFRPRTVRALAAAYRRISKLSLADSIGIDFHKTGFSHRISRACSSPAVAKTWSAWFADARRCRICSRAENDTPACIPSRHRGAGAACWRPTPTCNCSARRACAHCSVTWWKWRSRYVSTWKVTHRRPCSTPTTWAP